MRRTAVAMALVAALGVAGCSTTGTEEKSEDGEIITDFGVTDDAITLGIQTDQTGVFKVIGINMTIGHQLWADKVNADGGICDRTIEFDIGDHGYKADNAVPLYESQKQNVLGLIQLLGSPILAALKQKITADKVLSMPASWASNNLDSPSVLMIGATYDVEMINGLAYLQQEGMIADGDTIGQIYLDSESGQNTLMGTKFYAQEHDLTVIEVPVSAADTDLTATITKLKSQGVSAIAIMSGPAALGSAAVQMTNQGLDIPLLGSSPTYAPNLLADAQTTAALANYYLVQSVAPYTVENDLAEEIRAAFEDGDYADEPTQQVLSGYISGLAWQAILEKACDAGDLSRDGILAARDQVDDVETYGIMGNLDFSKPGAPTTRETFIEQVDPSVEGGLKVLEDLAVSEEAEAYKAPYEK